jgi:hypothetical protein
MLFIVIVFNNFPPVESGGDPLAVSWGSVHSFVRSTVGSLHRSFSPHLAIVSTSAVRKPVLYRIPLFGPTCHHSKARTSIAQDANEI